MIVYVGRAAGWNSLYNEGGLVHYSPPFQFGLTACGLLAIRRGARYHKTRAAKYKKCKRCFT